jgi:hypothetical protein
MSDETKRISYTITPNHLFLTSEVSSCLKVPAVAFLAFANAPHQLVKVHFRRENASFAKIISPLKAMTSTYFNAAISIGNPLRCLACSVMSSPVCPSHLVTALTKTPNS